MQNARKIAFKDNNPISSELGHNAKKCSAKKMFLFREKSCPFVIWQALNQLTTIDSGHINLENLLKLTIRKSVNKTGIFREKSDKKNGSLYTKSQHESCFLASSLLYRIVVPPPDRRVVHNDRGLRR